MRGACALSHLKIQQERQFRMSMVSTFLLVSSHDWANFLLRRNIAPVTYIAELLPPSTGENEFHPKNTDSEIRWGFPCLQVIQSNGGMTKVMTQTNKIRILFYSNQLMVPPIMSRLPHPPLHYEKKRKNSNSRNTNTTTSVHPWIRKKKVGLQDSACWPKV